MKTILNLIIAVTLVWYLCGCAGTEVKVATIDIRDTGKNIVKVLSDKDYDAEVTIIRIEF